MCFVEAELQTNTVDLMPPAAKNLFEKRFLDFQKLLVVKRFVP